eukprot:1154080-Pelagomonas_calceolata.AAC.3
MDAQSTQSSSLNCTFDTSFSINQSGKSVYVMEFNYGGTEEKVIDIVLHEGWGNIEKHLWFGDGYILVAFRSGRVVAVSTLKHEISEEVYSERVRDFSWKLCALEVTRALSCQRKRKGYIAVPVCKGGSLLAKGIFYVKARVLA